MDMLQQILYRSPVLYELHIISIIVVNWQLRHDRILKTFAECVSRFPGYYILVKVTCSAIVAYLALLNDDVFLIFSL